ncbi:MAG: hypothetical protein [Caudoviricetes sp.]|nr:MAG: hypothetical protein [Caudoviricetes sp.]
MIKQFIDFSINNVKNNDDLYTRIINIDPGRQSGKTTALQQVVIERVLRNETTVIIQNNANYRDIFIREIKRRLREMFSVSEVQYIMTRLIIVYGGGLREFCNPSSPTYRGVSRHNALIVFEEPMTYNKETLLRAFSAGFYPKSKSPSACRFLSFTGNPIILILGCQ